jgi:hypothetical protein
VSIRTYTTAILSDDGSLQAEVLSLPNFTLAGPHLLDELGESLGVEIQLVDDVPDESRLLDSLKWMADGAALEIQPGAQPLDLQMSHLIEAVAREPVVVVEESHPVTTSLTVLVTQAAPGWMFLVQQKPLLALVTEAVLVVVWFVAGPVKGARKGISEATEVVARDAFEQALRERFLPRRPRRRRR